MQDTNKAIFEEFLRDIRLDCKHLEKLYYALVEKLGNVSEHDLPSRQVLKEWVMDVFIDKAYEISSKVSAVYEVVVGN